MNRNIRQYLLAATALLSLAACNVKDPIFDTPHPAHGTVTLTTDWSHIGTGITAPDAYTLAAAPDASAATAPDAEYSATLTGITNRLDHLFAPGTYRFLVHNTAEHITVSGTTATVADAPSRPDVPSIADDAPGMADVPGHFVHSAPGWLFSSATDLAIAQDAEHTLTATMQQQVRQLTLIVEPTGGTIHRIERVEGYLTGAASALHLADGTHSEPANVAFRFSPVATGGDAGEAAKQWSATVRLLGVAGPVQKLVVSIRFADSSPADLTSERDISSQLSAFNTDKRTPLTLGSTIVETPTGADFGATITDWVPVNGGPVVAD